MHSQTVFPLKKHHYFAKKDITRNTISSIYLDVTKCARYRQEINYVCITPKNIDNL